MENSKNLNEEMLIRLKHEILKIEKENSKTKKYNREQIVEIIRKKMQTEVDRDGN
jgi:hypothetical protein